MGGLVVAGLVILLAGALAWLWQKTQSLNSEDHSQRDAALRELRSLDRTINQDVLRARYKLINSYEPVLASYRRVEELELVIALPPRFLDAHTQQRLAAAVAAYRASVTAKQQLIEQVKYRSATCASCWSTCRARGRPWHAWHRTTATTSWPSR